MTDHVIPKHKHLAKTALFWSALAIPLLVGMVLGILIFWSTEVGGVCFTPECVQNFFNIFKFPVAISSLSLPLVAMVAAIHRSMEAAVQIDFASRQYGEAIINNRFGNYLKHREGFEKVVDSFRGRTVHGEKCKIIVQTAAFYSELFPSSGFNNVSWTGQYNEKLLDAIEGHAKRIVLQAAKSEQEFDFVEFLRSVRYLNRTFHINYIPFITVDFERKSDSKKFNLVAPDFLGEAAAVYLSAADVLDLLAAIRGYIGINNSDDLSIGESVTNVISNISRSISKHKIKKHSI